MEQSGLVSPNSTEESLWLRFLAGETEAYEQLIATHYRPLFYYGSKFSKDREFIKDCIQDLFLHLWERRTHLSNEVVARPYLMASLRRHMHRSQPSGPLAFDHSAESNNDVHFEVEYSIEDRLIRQESSVALAIRIKTLLDAMPQRQKEVLYLKYFQDMDRKQISEIMNITPQTVSNLLQLAFRQLKKQWPSYVNL
ncbi:sigma-70 family RNA polymerase sigma factor [Telluribacter sp.]|jgi:RNA polymerase sigma factor (sigma-70 family)|uniref:RNA polymerase sigma factor n=1 Tax=Telluribacter sp. TaxID=1978767 RepID=UPI002E1174A3|nr:sigma-70 family RNA polymerase sigma factor [Telluribacter sp.]